jgi:hypothetical protein
VNFTGDERSELLLSQTGNPTSSVFIIDAFSQARLFNVLPFPGFRGDVAVGG